MCIRKKVEKIGIKPGLTCDQKSWRKQLWLIANAMDNRPEDHTNEFYLSLGDNLRYLRSCVQIWETEDKKALIELIDLMLAIFEHDQKH